MMERDFIQTLSYNTNNGGALKLIQRGHDGTVLVCDIGSSSEPDKKSN